MQALVEKIKAHLVKWEVEYICAACYAAGSFGILGKAVKLLAKFVG